MRRVAEAALTVGSVLGALAALVTVLAVTTGVRPLVVRSGSMEPAIPTGSMVFVRPVPASEVAVGDVIVVEGPTGGRVAHRVLAIEAAGGAGRTFTLKGDANKDPDAAPVTTADPSRLVWTAPGVGSALALLATAPGGFMLGSTVTALGFVVVRRRPRPVLAATPSPTGALHPVRLRGRVPAPSRP